VDKNLGYRCLQLKSYLEHIGAPPQPYCGGLSRGGYNYPGPNPLNALYNVECSARLIGESPVDEYRTNITTFAECIDFCHSRDDCKAASWDIRDYPYKCLLYKEDMLGYKFEGSWFNAYVFKTVPALPPPPPVSSAPPPPPLTSNPVPLLPSSTSRPPLVFTTLFPPFMPDFTPPVGAPPPPIPTDYPPRNVGGCCDGLVDGGHTIGDPPFEVEYDVECGTTIDYTGIMLTASDFIGFQDCLFLCRYYGTDCQAVMMYPDLAGFIILTDWTKQRYTTSERVAVAIKVRNGSGLTKRDSRYIEKWGKT